MPDYLIGIGHDLPLLSLAPFVVEPSTPGLLYGRRSFAASGIVVDELPHIPFTFEVLPEDDVDLRALYAQCGLLGAKTADVTIYAEDEDYNWMRFNGKAIKPQIGVDGSRDNLFFRNFTILVTKLRAAA